jgi:hypothetical protein
LFSSDLGKLAKAPRGCRDQIMGHMANYVARGEEFWGSYQPIIGSRVLLSRRENYSDIQQYKAGVF